MRTLLANNHVSEFADGGPPGGPWLPVARLPEFGWELKPEGVCYEETCTPLPAGREAEFVRDGWFSIGALAGHLSRPIAHDAETDTWCIGESAGDRRAALETLEAPNFTLPDHIGREHRLSDYRGKKVFLVSWASW